MDDYGCSMLSAYGPLNRQPNLGCVKQWRQTQAKHRYRVWRESQRQTGSVGSAWEGSEHKRTMLHALGIRAAVVAAAAVPGQSPPASQLWGATPESPYWSLEWAETHFLWAQATWRKEQKRGLRQVMVKWWKEEWKEEWMGVWGGWGRESVWVYVARWWERGRGGGGDWKKKKKGTKKIIEDISQAEAGLLRHTKLIKE